LGEGSDCSNEIANTTTDSNGVYIFNNLKPDTQYTICIDDSQFKDKKGVEGDILEGMVLTTVNADNNSKDYIDSDIDNSEDGSIAYITLTTGDIGDNNHSFDIGLIETYCIGDMVWLDEDKDGIQDGDEDSLYR